MINYNPNDAALGNYILPLKLTISTATKIKKNERLRCKVQFYTAHTGAGTATWYIGHDPLNTADPYGKLTSTKLQVFIPFVIDL